MQRLPIREVDEDGKSVAGPLVMAGGLLLIFLVALGFTLLKANLEARSDASLLELASQQGMYVERLVRQALTDTAPSDTIDTTIESIRNTTQSLLEGGTAEIDQYGRIEIAPLQNPDARNALRDFSAASDLLIELVHSAAEVDENLEKAILKAGLEAKNASQKTIRTLSEKAAANAQFSHRLLSAILAGISLAGLFLLVISYRYFRDRENLMRHGLLLGDISLFCSEGKAIEETMRVCARAINRHCKGSLTQIWLLNQDTQALEVFTGDSRNDHLDISHSRIPFGKDKINHIRQSKMPYFTNELTRDSSVCDPEWARQERIQAFAGYPIMVNHRCEGVLAIVARQSIPASFLSTLTDVVNALGLGVARLRYEAQATKLMKEMQEVRAALDEHALVTIFDADGIITYANNRLCEISKYQKKEFVGQDFRFNRSDAQSEAFYDELWEAISKGAEWNGEMKNTAKDGSFYWVDTTIVPFFGDGEDPRQYICIQTDVTESRLVREALEYERYLMNAFMENVPASIYFKDSESRYIRSNPEYRSKLRVYDAEDILGKSDFDFFSPEFAAQTRADEEEIMRKGKGVTKEENQKWDDGRETWAISIKMPLRDEKGQVTGTFGISQDITERKRAEKELESFSYSVSHDLRAPIRHIEGYLDLLRRQLGDDLSEKGQHYMEVIDDSTKRMGQLIDDLLGFSRMARIEPQKQSVHLQKLVQESLVDLQPFEEDRNIEWIHGELPIVIGDPAMLKQVFVNLFSNAIKYTKAKDPAVIEYGVFDNAAKETVFFVKDNGAGFEMKYKSKLFEVFQRLHKAEDFEGTGIGLAIVRRIISRHGGRTWAKGKLNHGATFFFSIPTAGQSIPTPKDEPNQKNTTSRRQRKGHRVGVGSVQRP